MGKTLVLLSGGLDSTAALLWARRMSDAEDMRALFIYYGQPAGQRECERAIAVTRQLDVHFERVDISSTYYGMGAGVFMPQPSSRRGAVDTAFVPLRNPVLLGVGAARGLIAWPDQIVQVVVGFNYDDAAGFPDCTQAFIAAWQNAINVGLGRHAVQVIAPWIRCFKRDVVRWVQDNAAEQMPLIDASWSCYRERGPCGECTACVVRQRALQPAEVAAVGAAP